MLAIRVSIGGIDPGGDGLVEVALDQAREALVEGVRLRLEHAPGAHRVEEQQARHRPVAGERREHGVDRHLGAGDGLRLQRARPRSTRPTSLSAVVSMSSRKIDSLFGKWK